MQLAKALFAKCTGRKHGYSVFASLLPTRHGPKSMNKKRANYFVCGAFVNY